MRLQHLQMLHKEFSVMADKVWDSCPSNTNAVERKNQDCKDSHPVVLRSAMINLYKLDKSVCCRYLAAKDGVCLSYGDHSVAGRKAAANLRQKQRLNKSYRSDPDAEKGPPDRLCHLKASTSRKRQLSWYFDKKVKAV